MKQWERRQMEVNTEYGYLLWRDLPPDFDRALRLLPSRFLVQAALRQGQVYARRRTWCSNCGRYAGRLDREGQCQRCAAWWRANPLPVEAQAGQEGG